MQKNPDRNKEIVSLYQEGHSTPQVAAMLGISQATVYRILHNSGVKCRSISEAQKLNRRTAAKSDLSDCVHHWICGEPRDRAVHARCSKCGTETDFPADAVEVMYQRFGETRAKLNKSMKMAAAFRKKT